MNDKCAGLREVMKQLSTERIKVHNLEIDLAKYKDAISSHKCKKDALACVTEHDLELWEILKDE